MGIRPCWGLLLLCACNAELGHADDASLGLDDNGAGRDGNPQGQWGMPAKVAGADSTADEDDGTLSSTRLELYFKRVDGTDANLYVMTRQTPTSAWGMPEPLTVLNSTVGEETPRLSPNDLTMYFGRNGDIYMTTRTAVGQPWGAPTPVTALNTTDYEKWAAVCDGGYAIVSRSTTMSSQDLFAGTVDGGATTALTQLNSTAQDQGAMLTSDCLKLYFQSNRSGTFDLYVATRASAASDWVDATALVDFNTATFSEEDPWMSTDQRTFVFADNAAGNKDIYMSTR